MSQGVGVQRIVRKVMEGNRGLRKDGPVFYAKSGPWRAEIEPGTFGGRADKYRLIHYGTTMLEWEIDNRGVTTITGTWTGWGSVSDQTGVNAALRVLGSSMRYSRDARGGGPRINPRFMAPGAMMKFTPHTAPTYI